MGFVIIEEHSCIINTTVKKSSLENSTAYVEMQDWLEFRNLLLFEPVDKIAEKLFD